MDKVEANKVRKEENIFEMRFQELLRRETSEISKHEDDFPFAIQFMEAFKAQLEQGKSGNLFVSKKTQNADNQTVEKELAEELNKRAYDYDY